MKTTKAFLDKLTYNINGAAIEVHKALGPGLLEKVYQRCLLHELQIRNLSVKTEFIIPIEYKGVIVDTELRCDLLVENLICIEIKAVKELIPIHDIQLISYMKLLKVPKGILYNFHVTNLYTEGQKIFVNKFFDNLD
jgi:GxxExxY protein